MIKNNRLIFVSIFLATFAADVFSKMIIDAKLHLGQRLLVLPGLLSFEKAYNTGGAFSILQNSTLLLSLISIITIGILFYIVLGQKIKLNTLEILAFAFICGGAAGNLYDRLILGHVVDFIQLEFINFPIFNLGDIFINIGVIILLFNIVLGKNVKQNNLM